MVIMLLGIKLKTLIWIGIAIVLGLIFSMTLWPGWWRMYFKKKKEREELKEKLGKKTKKTPPIVIIFLVFLLMIIAFFVGSMFGFDRAVQSAPYCQDERCLPLDCAQIEIQNCPGCTCELCGNIVRIEIPTS